MRILVVEDELLIAMDVCHVLTDAGHDVIGPGKTADEGLALAQAARPNLALLNIDLGGEPDGIHLARTLFNTFGVPVSDNLAAAWATKDAALGNIAKPCQPSTLVQSIRLVEALVGGATPEARYIPHGLTLFQMPGHPPLS